MKLALAILFVLGSPATARSWGDRGHALIVRAALAAGDDLPSWFREAGDVLADLSNAPDRWREVEPGVPALAARRPEHFFDLDVWGRAPLPPDRWRYADEALRRRLRPDVVGTLPYGILEHYGALLAAFRDARGGRPGGRVGALDAAGILAHLAGDAVVPLHATRHHHGWLGPNPRGFTRLGEIHRWFETELVQSVDARRVTTAPAARTPLPDVPEAVAAAIAESLQQVPAVYEAERRARLEHDEADARALVRERLGSGATFLARLWLTAWVRSAP